MKRLGLAAAWATVVFLGLGRPAAAAPLTHFLYGLSSTRSDGRATAAEIRLRLEAAGGSPIHYQFKLDGISDMALGDGRAEVREGYFTYSGRQWEAQAGRKTVTWGVADLLFINDVFPKDYESFFVGRPIEYLKRPSDGLFTSYFGNGWSADLAATGFRADKLPGPDRFTGLPDPFSGLSRRAEERPERMEYAARLYGNYRGLDVAAFTSAGYFNQPSYRLDSPEAPTTVTPFYPRLNTYGFTLQGSRFRGLVSLEAGYYDSVKDRKGANPMIPNSDLRVLLGYQRELGTDFTAGLQYYAQWMQDYGAFRNSLPAGFPPQDRVRHIVTLRLMRLLNYQTLKLSFFGFYSPSDGDAYLIPEVSYAYSDTVNFTLGANLFRGSSFTSFGALNSNDNAYFVTRYSF